MTPLHSANLKNHEEIVQLLLQPSIEARGKDDTTILHWLAAATDSDSTLSLEHLKRVLKVECDPTVKDEDDRLAWEWAAENDGDDCSVAVLLRKAVENYKVVDI